MRTKCSSVIGESKACQMTRETYFHLAKMKKQESGWKSVHREKIERVLYVCRKAFFQFLPNAGILRVDPILYTETV